MQPGGGKRDGQRDAYRDVVLLNSAAALLVAGRVDDLKDGVSIAAAAIDQGSVNATLERLVAITNSAT